MNKKEDILKNVTIGWCPCCEESYPKGEPVIIAYWNDSDKKWNYWLFENCPYGWNVLCRSEAYFRNLKEPFRTV